MAQEKLLHGGLQIARVLKEEGVKYHFGVGGGHIFPIMDGLGQIGSKMIHCRHEQAGAYAADAYARASGKLGVCFGTAGPGMTNTISGIAQAYFCKSPVLALYGQNMTFEDGRNPLQEGSAMGVVAPFTKWTARVVDPTLMCLYTKRAVTDAMTYPPAPVALEIPVDIQSKKNPASTQRHYVDNAFQKPAPDMADPASVEKAVKSLLEAERPVIVGGEGVFWAQAGDELKALVEFLQIPVITRRVGRGAIREDHPLAFSGRARGKILRGADVAVTIGLKLGYLEGYGAWTKNLRLIQINAALSEVESLVPSDMVIIANPKATLKQMLECARSMVKEAPKKEAWLKAVDEIKQKDRKRMADTVEATKGNKPMHPGWVAKCCAEVLDDSATIILDALTGSAYMTERFEGKMPGSVLESGNWAGVGHGVAMGIGAQVARPGKQVLVTMGDGGIGIGGFDVETAVRSKLPVVYVIHNNNAWMASMNIKVREIMPTLGMEENQGPFSILPTRYDQLFAAFGAYTERVEDPADMLPALRRAFESGKTAVIDAVVDDLASEISIISSGWTDEFNMGMMGWLDKETTPAAYKAFVAREA